MITRLIKAHFKNTFSFTDKLGNFPPLAQNPEKKLQTKARHKKQIFELPQLILLNHSVGVFEILSENKALILLK
jgi:hypothetical protein